MKISVFWFRRDLRLDDNTALRHALNSGLPVLPVFIFDDNIIEELSPNDARINFIYDNLHFINKELNAHGSAVLILKGDPVKVWEKLIAEYDIGGVFLNRDYEPYALFRDGKIRTLLKQSNINLHDFKDQVIFERDEIVKEDGKPYTVFTPYKKRWLANFATSSVASPDTAVYKTFMPLNVPFPGLSDLGFVKSKIKVKDFDLSVANHYAGTRDLPGQDATSYLGPHLRFGTISIRRVIGQLKPHHEVFLSELVWREFFMQILYHFPEVVDRNFHTKYDGIAWRNNEIEFDKWCMGETGYPLVDAGICQLNETGYMHNRVRMVVASFLCKHLLIDWRWGEAWFAERLLDYELSSNNGNWQWAAGTGCDAAPYFRIFNPAEQQRKFDRDLVYIKRWIPNYHPGNYSPPVVEHKFARERALETYKKGISNI